MCEGHALFVVSWGEEPANHAAQYAIAITPYAGFYLFNDTGSGTAHAKIQQAWYDIDRAVPLTRWLGEPWIDASAFIIVSSKTEPSTQLKQFLSKKSGSYLAGRGCITAGEPNDDQGRCAYAASRLTRYVSILSMLSW